MPRASPYPTAQKNQQCPHCQLWFARVQSHLNQGPGCPHDPTHDVAAPADPGIPRWVRVGGNSCNDGEGDESSILHQPDGDESLEPPQPDADESMSPSQPDANELSDNDDSVLPSGVREPTEPLTFRQRSARV